MKVISTRSWILSALMLMALGLAADYFFLHYLFKTPSSSRFEEPITSLESPIEGPEQSLHARNEEKSPTLSRQEDFRATVTPSEINNFRESLERCAPEIATQRIETPEALLDYLTKAIGTEKHEHLIENYHLTLPDGSERRIQVVADDNTNSTSKKELRFFKLDQEGYPERLSLKHTDTLEGLLSLGELKRQEIKSVIQLKDGTSLNLEIHNKKVFEFQFNNLGKMLSCRNSSCHCP